MRLLRIIMISLWAVGDPLLSLGAEPVAATPPAEAVAKAEAEGDWQSAENAYMNLAHAYLFSNKTQEARKIYKKRGPNNIDWYGSTFAMGVRDDFDNFRKAGVVDPMIQKEMLVIEDEDLRDATKPSDPSH